MTEWALIGYVALAMLLGAVIGLEREVEDKPAGLRTHMLVAGAAAFFVMLGDVMVRNFQATLPQAAIQSDPVRIIEALAAGVSFLGAGTILRHENRVIGLTTAASILFTAAVGVAVALNQIILACGVTVIILVTLRGLGAVDRWVAARDQEP
jgi:putative Mg2+ transporter-C (MgtC) family protein